jgi:hypothetical protein
MNFSSTALEPGDNEEASSHQGITGCFLILKSSASGINKGVINLKMNRTAQK